MNNSFYNLTITDLKNYLLNKGLPLKGATLLYNWHYKKNKRTILLHQDLSNKTRSTLYNDFNFNLPEIIKTQCSNDKTVKFLFKLDDGLTVESVLIPFQNKYTICISSQVGCAMNCAFCFTGKQGFTRHLSTFEIIGQFLQTKEWLTKNRPGDDRILNIVFMGQGEPLHNFDNVKKATEIFLTQNGLSLASHKITISTSGYLPGLLRWKNEMPDVNIALSLHSPFTEKRNELIPINKKYPLNEVIKLVEAIPQEFKRFVTYEYLIIKNFNDSPEDAIATGELLKGTKAFINLIPFNPFPGAKYERPDQNTIIQFKNILDQYGVPVTIRTTKGDEILAACGQLNTKLS